MLNGLSFGEDLRFLDFGAGGNAAAKLNKDAVSGCSKAMIQRCKLR